MAAPLRKCLGFCKIDFLPIFCSNFNNSRSYSSRGLKKFYKIASVSQNNGWFEINLDKRKLKTPGGNLFRVPNEALAYAVATEWNSQQKEIKRTSMHLTSLCNTAIDNPMMKTRTDLINSIIHYLETDTVSFRETETPDLLLTQNKEWDPVVNWIQNRYEIKVPIIHNITDGQDLPERTVAQLSSHMESHNTWALFGYSYATECTKSLVLTLALMDKYISVEKCVQLSRLEQDFQVQRWGNVEWHHDIDKFELRCRLSAAALFVNWANEEHIVKKRVPVQEAQ